MTNTERRRCIAAALPALTTGVAAAPAFIRNGQYSTLDCVEVGRRIPHVEPDACCRCRCEQ